MLTPFEIDLLRQDLQSALSVIDQDEIADAQALIRKHGFRSEDFEIFQQADLSPPHPAPVTGRVVVKRKSSESARQYSAGSGSYWLMELETDLKSDAFGRP